MRSVRPFECAVEASDEIGLVANARAVDGANPIANLQLLFGGAQRAECVHEHVAASVGAGHHTPRGLRGGLLEKKQDYNVRYGKSGLRHMGEMGWVGEEKNLECDERVAVAEQRDERRERLVRVELLVRDAYDAIPPEEVVEQRRREALGELPTRVPLGAEPLEAELRHVKNQE